MSDARKTGVIQFSGHHSYSRRNFHILLAVFRGQMRLHVPCFKLSCIFQACHKYYTTFTNFSMKYLAICKVYTDVGGIK